MTDAQFGETQDPEKAARSLFDEAIPAMGPCADELVEDTFLPAEQGGTVHRGTADEVRELILRDLRHMAREPGFKSFRVENSGGTVYRQSTVLCFMGPESRFGADVGVPINAWMTESGECVANGLDPSWIRS